MASINRFRANEVSQISRPKHLEGASKLSPRVSGQRRAAKSECLSRGHLRRKLLDDVLTELSISKRNGDALAKALNRKRTLHPRRTNAGLPNERELEESISEEALIEELDSWLELISGFTEPSDKQWKDDDASEHSLSSSLPKRIQTILDEVSDMEEEVDVSYRKIEDLVTIINEAHPKLQSDLIDSLQKHPPSLNQKHVAQDALQITTIEAALVKLSLIRSRCHQALYDFKAGDAKISDALQLAYESLREEAANLEEEAGALDQQLLEYEGLLELVDGKGGSSGFRQMVEDWIRVQKEMEDCQRDLRRLGWTGD
uniref:Uncharacterized protein n=1 Tax=Moniliophthora roreri TaxID=221103 RepID=A0A0W0G9W8_MONRR